MLAAREFDSSARVLYVVGGLYGNFLALESLVEKVKREEGEVGVVFNGDFNFFNAQPVEWLAVNSRIRGLADELGAEVEATAGNIELEVSTTPADGVVGCGCAYPVQVPAEVGERAAAIVQRLHAVAWTQSPDLLLWLSTLKPTSTWRVGDSRVGITHGDPECLNGWSLAAEAFGEWATTDQATVEGYFREGDVDIIACTHTCLPFVAEFDKGTVVNNGAAGMGNFRGSTHGVVTRISTPDAPRAVEALYAAVRPTGVRIEAVPLAFDLEAWLEYFEATWPPGSPAHTSYHDRIKHGVAHWPVGRAVQVG